MKNVYIAYRCGSRKK